MEFYSIQIKNIHKQFEERKDEIYKNMFNQNYDNNKEYLFLGRDAIFFEILQRAFNYDLQEIKRFNDLINIAKYTIVYEEKADLEEMLNKYSFNIEYTVNDPTIEIETWTNRIGINNIYQVEIKIMKNYLQKNFKNNYQKN